jgi:hypothetical protein
MGVKALALNVLARTQSVPSGTRLSPSTAQHTSVERADAAYHASVEAALDTICHPEYPSGMILWLETVDPGLYDRLTCALPDLISRLWKAHAPLDEFQRVVDEWLATHRRACSLFKSQER